MTPLHASPKPTCILCMRSQSSLARRLSISCSQHATTTSIFQPRRRVCSIHDVCVQAQQIFPFPVGSDSPINGTCRTQSARALQPRIGRPGSPWRRSLSQHFMRCRPCQHPRHRLGHQALLTMQQSPSPCCPCTSPGRRCWCMASSALKVLLSPTGGGCGMQHVERHVPACIEAVHCVQSVKQPRVCMLSATSLHPCAKSLFCCTLMSRAGVGLRLQGPAVDPRRCEGGAAACMGGTAFLPQRPCRGRGQWLRGVLQGTRAHLPAAIIEQNA